jgi:adenine-specific DNA-methyltransferase
MKKPEKLPMCTPNLADKNYATLAALFPNAVTETIDENGIVVRAIDADVLAQEINTRVVSGREERYQFTWPDKKKSMLLANAPIAAALRPCREESVDFDNTENLYIEGDNLDVLKLLRENYLGRVKMIYIDPPYNTGNDFIYEDDFAGETGEFLYRDGQYDEQGNRLTPNLDSNGRFHTDWLNMMYPRLKIAKQLLADDGVLVVAIDENEQATVSMILKEIFREGGYEHVCVSVVHNPGGTQGSNFSFTHEYAVFVFPKGKRMIQLQDRTDNPDIRPLRDVSTGNHLRTDAKNCFYPIFVKNSEIIGFGDVSDDSYHPQSANVQRDDGVIEVYPIDAKGNERKWVWARHTVEGIRNELRVVKNSRRGIADIERVKTNFNYKTVWIDDKYNANSYGSKLLAKLMPNCGFDFPKSLYTVLDCVKAVTLNDKEAIILDFFSGWLPPPMP